MLIYQECNFWGVPQGKLINRNCVLSQLDLNEQKNPTDQNVRCSPEFSIFLKFNLHFGHPPTEKKQQETKKYPSNNETTKTTLIFSYKQIHSPPPPQKNKERPFAQSPANIKPKFFFAFFWYLKTHRRLIKQKDRGPQRRNWS